MKHGDDILVIGTLNNEGICDKYRFFCYLDDGRLYCVNPHTVIPYPIVIIPPDKIQIDNGKYYVHIDDSPCYHFTMEQYMRNHRVLIPFIKSQDLINHNLYSLIKNK